MMTRKLVAILVCSLAGGLAWAGVASAAPAWECVPATAGQPVVSGGTGSAPSCGAGTRAVAAPTYVASGVGGKPTVQFTGVNVQIINGSGKSSTLDGTGNLIIGYNESPGKQTGSHNLIVGTRHGYTSYGGLIAGYQNTITAAYATVTGGTHNHGTGPYSSVSGGYGSVASGSYSSVSGGGYNNATNSFASVSGGVYNHATGARASVSGGCGNVAGAFMNTDLSTCYQVQGAQSVLGGMVNVASGDGATVSGGGWVDYDRYVNQFYSEGNQASGQSSSITGGYENRADPLGSAILGGAVHHLTQAGDTYPAGP